MHNALPLDDKSTAKKIAEQTKVNPSTVQRAEKFADAVDKVAENTGINPQKILSGVISASRRDIETVSKLEPEKQKKVFEKIENREVKTMFAKHAGKLVLWTAAKTFLSTFYRGVNMPSAQPTLEKIHFLLYPEDEKEVQNIRAQKKPLACHIPLRTAHDWSPNKNGIRYCLKCGKVDFYFGITGMLRKFEEDH